VALGGPDTTTREKTVWQVKLQLVNEVEVRAGFGPNWAPWNAKSTSLLSARAKPGAEADDSTTSPPGSGYQRLENQLYRVEIHDGGAPTGSPPSAAMTRVQGIAGAEVQVANDGRLWQAGEIIELFGDVDSATPDTLARIVAVDERPQAGTSAGLRAVDFGYPDQPYAVGDDATILASKDGGANWTAQKTPEGMEANLQGVYFAGSNGWAVGDDVTILASKDSGTTWTRQTTQVLTLEKDESGIEPQPTHLRRVATFKFSRDNGTVLTRLEEINGDVITVSNPGRDLTLGFADGRWVELSDEEHVLRGEPGILVRLASVEGNDLTVDRWPDDTRMARSDFGTLPTVRRWDSERSTPVTTGTWLDLENGVEVQFALDTPDKEAQVADEFHTGDYWTIPARSLTGDVEWPQGDPGSQASVQPVFKPRHGIDYHYCPLALLELKDRTWSLISDYRKLFPPVTELIGSGIRVAGIFLESTGQALRPELAVADRASGIRVACEANIDPNLANGKRLCSVTLDMPFPSNDQDR
jgi:hypothetical protein